MTTPWTRRYAQRMQWMGSSIIRQLLKLTEQPEIISFAGGLPAPELFPVKAFAEATNKVLARHGSQALQYSTTEGYLPLRELIVERMSRYGIPARPENVLLTNFHNPAGVTLSGERRQRIIRMADEYGIPIVEDDPYGQLRYEGEHLPPLLVLDARQLNGEGANGSGRSNDTFSLTPGRR